MQLIIKKQLAKIQTHLLCWDIFGFGEANNIWACCCVNENAVVSSIGALDSGATKLESNADTGICTFAIPGFEHCIVFVVLLTPPEQT